MRRIFVLSGLAFVSHGWQAQIVSDKVLRSPCLEIKRHDGFDARQVAARKKHSNLQQSAEGMRNSPSVLVMLLLASDPAAAFHWPSSGHTTAARRCAPVAARETGLSISDRVAESWKGAVEFLKAFVPPKLKEDIIPEAIELRNALIVQGEKDMFGQLAGVPTLSNLTIAYAGASAKRIFQNPAVKDRVPDVFNTLNAVLVIIFLRTLLPRLIAMQSMQDLYEFAPELGLPTRDELLEFVDFVADYDYATKVAIYLLVFTVEKLTLIGEFLPFGVLLPAVSPLLFGGVLEGTAVSAACASISSSTNFMISRTFLQERALKLEVFDQPPVGETAWFRALSRSIEKGGFKAALFLRLAPVLPIPIDAHWYIAGLTPLTLWEFIAGYFVGVLKTCFIDAYLGSLLTSAALGTDKLEASSQGIVVAETIGVITISVLVSQYATQVFSDMLQEEGFDVGGSAANTSFAAPPE